MDSNSVNKLNGILKGEYMAIGAYDRFISDAESSSVSNMLQEIRQDHKRHAGMLADRIRRLGGKPYETTGLAGAMASVKGSMQSMTRRGGADLLENAYDGEDKGIAAAEELAKGDLDSESRQLVSEIMSEDHEHLKKMARMLGKLEERK